MSGLTKKQVWVDRNLSAVLGVTEGELISYSDIQKNLHKYIKDHDLKNPLKGPRLSTPTATVAELPRKSQITAPQPQTLQHETALEALAGGRYCQSCGAHIPSDAIFCDMCGEGLTDA